MTTTRAHRRIEAPRARVYRALVDPADIVRWKAPDDMHCEVHEFDGRVGGSFRVSLTYDAPEQRGKSSAHTDTYRGSFTELVADEKVVEVDRFESDDDVLTSPMTITFTLTDADGGTDLVAVHEGLPEGVDPADNELGWSQSLARLAALVEPA